MRNARQTIRPLDERIRRYCWIALRRHDFNVIETAKALQIGKTTLYRWLQQWYGSGYKTLVQAGVLGKIDRRDSNESKLWVR